MAKNNNNNNNNNLGLIFPWTTYDVVLCKLETNFFKVTLVKALHFYLLQMYQFRNSACHCIICDYSNYDLFFWMKIKSWDTISPCPDLLHACVFSKASNIESLLNEYHSVSLYKSHPKPLHIDVKCSQIFQFSFSFFWNSTFYCHIIVKGSCKDILQESMDSPFNLGITHFFYYYQFRFSQLYWQNGFLSKFSPWIHSNEYKQA